MAKKKKTEFPMNNEQREFMFEVAQEMGVFGRVQRKPGLTAPSTGADELTKTDHGSYARFNPKG
ncbi:hypothetical protein JOC37_002626 [Desulfohalotomaculum tongense]|uniref:hypothetical protein n=1 Tax=Desulforadius tongensis TaxID=1216062 RepID=UPI00195BE6E8|nr:hypothetical protein [Desulforadius tongensis]MBM7856193.1 hypothetical protein [Desulforadius tongensis]